MGKAAEIPEAIRKAKEDAMKKVVTVPMDENNSIPHDYIGKFGSATVMLKRAPEGTGVIAGGPVRAVVETVGIKDIRAKALRSNNPCNVVRATLDGLAQLRNVDEVAAIRGKSEKEILG